jgi:hypothetical protein
VRYFAEPDGKPAAVVQSAISQLGFKSALKLMKVARPTSPGLIEVWFRKDMN